MNTRPNYLRQPTPVRGAIDVSVSHNHKPWYDASTHDQPPRDVTVHVSSNHHFYGSPSPAQSPIRPAAAHSSSSIRPSDRPPKRLSLKNLFGNHTPHHGDPSQHQYLQPRSPPKPPPTYPSNWKTSEVDMDLAKSLEVTSARPTQTAPSARPPAQRVHVFNTTQKPRKFSLTTLLQRRTAQTTTPPALNRPGRRICHVPISVFYGILVIPFSCIVTFLACALFTWIGSKVWGLTVSTPAPPPPPTDDAPADGAGGTPISVHPDKVPFSIPIAQAMILGCAVLNSFLCFLALALFYLIRLATKHTRPFVMWSVIVAGTAIASLFVGAVGIAIFPDGGRDSQGGVADVSARDALEASAIGLVTVLLPIGAVALLRVVFRKCSVE